MTDHKRPGDEPEPVTSQPVPTPGSPESDPATHPDRNLDDEPQDGPSEVDEDTHPSEPDDAEPGVVPSPRGEGDEADGQPLTRR